MMAQENREQRDAYPSWVIIHGLTGAAELNGRLARVMGPPNAQGRHEVAVGHPYAAGMTPDSAFKGKLIRTANLHWPRERPPLASLAAMGAASAEEPRLGVVNLVLHDALCPRQRLRLFLSREADGELAERLFYGAPSGTLGMLGTMNDRGVPCSHGVEVHLEQPLTAARPPPSFEPMAPVEQGGGQRTPAHELAARHPPSPIVAPPLGAGRVALVGGDVFELVELLEPLPSAAGRWFTARVLWLPAIARVSRPPPRQPAMEGSGSGDADGDSGGGVTDQMVDALSSLVCSNVEAATASDAAASDAAASATCATLVRCGGAEVSAELRAAGERLCALVPTWLQLVRAKGRAVDMPLSDLGPMPAATHADALSLWVAALINPLPPLNLAPQVRAAALCAPASKQRLSLVLAAMEQSIEFLQGSDGGGAGAPKRKRSTDLTGGGGGGGAAARTGVVELT